jgi:hypothetical protein
MILRPVHDLYNQWKVIKSEINCQDLNGKLSKRKMD